MIKRLAELFTRLKSSEFVINVSKLTTGTAIAQIISVTMAPILYRIYEREHYGTLGMYMAITSVLGVFSTMQYLQAIMLEKEDKNAVNAMWLNRFINVGFAVLVALVLLIFSPVFSRWANNEALSRWFWMIPVGIFFAGQNEIFRVWANRKKEYNLLTFNAILLAILTPLISISLGLLIKDETGLFVGLLVGQSLPALILFFILSRSYDLGINTLDLRLVKNLSKTHKGFPLYIVPQNFISTFTNSIPVFMINKFSGLAILGDYNLAVRILGLPISFIGNAISAVFSQEITKRFNLFGSYRDIFLKTFKTLFALSLPPVIIFILFSKEIFIFAFGANWQNAGLIAGFMAPLFALKMINSPLSYGFYLHNLQKLDLIFTIIYGSGSYFIFVLFLKSGLNILDVLKIYTLFASIIYIILIIINYKLSQRWSSPKEIDNI